MARNKEKFADLLTAAIYNIKSKKKKTIEAIQDELGYAVGYEGGASIEYWRKGNVPPDLNKTIKLANELFKQGGITTREEFDQLLLSADHFNPEELEKYYDQLSCPTLKHENKRIPLQRPPRSEYFTGRETELEWLKNNLKCGQVTTLWGPGGIGKTALATEAIWALAPGDKPPEEFPDGIVICNFYRERQIDATLRKIARDFGVTTNDDDSPFYAAQNALDSRKALIVLDGAENLEDLSPILDLSSTCGVLIITRNNKQVVNKEYEIHLVSLPLEHAISILQYWAEEPFVANKEFAAQLVCELVGSLPLALKIAGKYMHSTKQNVEELAEWLVTSPLEALDHGNRQSQSIPTLLKKSIEVMSQEAQRALGLVGILAPSTFDHRIIASGLKTEPYEARNLLGELVAFGLVDRTDHLYIVGHPLIYIYANQQLLISSEELRGVVRHFLGVWSEKEGIAELREHLIPVLMTCHSQKEWQLEFDLAMAELNQTNLSTTTKLINPESLYVCELASEASEKIGNKETWALLEQILGNSYVPKSTIPFTRAMMSLGGVGIPDENTINHYWDITYLFPIVDWLPMADTHYQQALEIYRELGNQDQEINILYSLAHGYFSQKKYEQAKQFFQQLFNILQKQKKYQTLFFTITNIADTCIERQDFDQANYYCQHIVKYVREVWGRGKEIEYINQYAMAFLRLGAHDLCLEYYRKLLEIYQEEGIDLSNVRQSTMLKALAPYFSDDESS